MDGELVAVKRLSKIVVSTSFCCLWFRFVLNICLKFFQCLLFSQSGPVIEIVDEEQSARARPIRPIPQFIFADGEEEEEKTQS